MFFSLLSIYNGLKTKIGFAVLLFFVMVFSASSVAEEHNLTAGRILKLVNEDRAESGLSQLSLNPTLSLAAFAKAEDMISKNYFAHESPEGNKPWTWFKALGYNYVYAGENLALGYSDPQDLEQSWMSSPSHRANILSPYYSEVGLAIVSKNNTSLVVQFFGSRSNQVSLIR